MLIAIGWRPELELLGDRALSASFYLLVITLEASQTPTSVRGVMGMGLLLFGQESAYHPCHLHIGRPVT
jgi:hypothetical protein